MSGNILSLLEEISYEKGNLAKIAKYLLEYKGNLKELTISRICEELDVSVATATRLAKKIGLKGFNELKYNIIEEKNRNRLDSNKHEYIDQLKYYDYINEALRGTITNLKMSNIEIIRDKIIKAPKINFYALGSSQIILNDFAYKLIRLKKNVSIHSDIHFQYVEASNSCPGELSLALSYSGVTKEVIEFLELSKQRGASTVLITNNKRVDYNFVDTFIYINSEENMNRIHSIASRISTIAVLDLLYLTIVNTNKEKYEKILTNTRVIR